MSKRQQKSKNNDEVTAQQVPPEEPVEKDHHETIQPEDPQPDPHEKSQPEDSQRVSHKKTSSRNKHQEDPRGESHEELPQPDLHSETPLRTKPSTPSPMYQHVVDMVENISRAFINADMFVSKYDTIINELIPDLNNQITTYERNGKSAIKREILNSVLGMIDFNTLADRLRTDGKSKRKANITTSSALQQCKYHIGQIDTDLFVDVYNELDDPKEYKKNVKACLNELYNMVNQLSTFENNLVEYRTLTISKLNMLIDHIYEHHYNFATTYKTIATPTYDFKLAGKSISIPLNNKTQKGFITETYKQLINQL